jgi:thiosulfate dehydrogenase (quinone) large subunit
MTPTTNSATLDRQLAFAVFRLTLGINIFALGASRIFGAGAVAFASAEVVQFNKTALPAGMVRMFFLVVPFAELALGTLTTLGLFTRWALTLGGLLIAILVYGTVTRGDWNTVTVEMLYAVTYYLLLVSRSGNNRFSLDAVLFSKR